MWFSYDPEDGIKFHETPEEAKDRAERALEEARDIAIDDGWETSVTEICWGVVSGHACQSASVTLKEGDDPYVDYQMIDSEAHGRAVARTVQPLVGASGSGGGK
jgi:nucleotide-binding universal stress UspA family protein